jgi:hypothetical protein
MIARLVAKGSILLLVLVIAGCTSTGGMRTPTEHIAPDPKAAEINMRLGLN